jgi:hypothetical protein
MGNGDLSTDLALGVLASASAGRAGARARSIPRIRKPRLKHDAAFTRNRKTRRWMI